MLKPTKKCVTLKERFFRYLPIDDEVFSSAIFLTSGGRAVIPAGTIYPPSGHPDLYQFDWREGRILPEFSLVWIEEGAGWWETRAGSFPITCGQVGQVFPGEWHRYRPDRSTGWTESWLQFNGRLAHELRSSGVCRSERPVRTLEKPRRFYQQFRDLLRDLRAPAFTNSPTVGLRVAGLLGQLYDAGPPPSSVHSLVDKALSHIWSFSHRQLDVAQVARHLGVGRRTLERAFSDEKRSGVLEEITRCRLNRAERLLLETRLPIKHIVSLSGFGTAEQMRLHFQARHGQPPAEYRSRAGESA